MVLIIDDEIEICESIQELLDLNHINAEICSCPELAVKNVSTGKYACVITDIAMPKVNGIELSKTLKLLNPNIIIICISSFAEVMQEDLRSARVDFCFPKPFSTNSLVACVKTCLLRAGAAA